MIDPADVPTLQATAAMTDQVARVSGLAEVQERIRIAERRVSEIENELIALRDEQVDESEVGQAGLVGH